MEQFKKWLDKEISSGQEVYPSSHDDCERAWRAALEWINGYPSYDMADSIYEELGEEQREL